jgi:dipeptidyl-peptidase-4
MSDAILKGNTALAPTNLRATQWIPGTAQFTHVSGNKFVRVNAQNQSVDTLDFLFKVNQSLKENGVPELENLPSVKWLAPGVAWFSSGNNVYNWSENGGASIKNTMPANAENTDIQEKTLAVAYTKGNSLYITAQNKETAVALSDEDGIVYGKSVHRDEFGISKGTFWSPMGRSLALAPWCSMAQKSADAALWVRVHSSRKAKSFPMVP